MSVPETAVFMSPAVLGGALIRYPVGLVPDRVERRCVMTALSTASLVLGVILIGIVDADPAVKLAAAPPSTIPRRSGLSWCPPRLFLVFGTGSVLGPRGFLRVFRRRGASIRLVRGR